MQLTTKSEWTSGNKNLGGISLISHLFNRLNIIYPGKIMHAYPTPEALKEAEDVWAEYLAEDKVTGAEVKTALMKCRTGARNNAFPPTYPEFMQLCRPKPDYFTSFNDAINLLMARRRGEKREVEPAVYWAAVEIGEYDMMKARYSEIKGRWATVLDKHLQDKNIKPIPAVPERQKVLEHKEPGKNKEIAAENMKRLRKALSGINKL